MDDVAMYIWFDGVAGTGICRGVLGEEVDLGSSAVRDEEAVEDSGVGCDLMVRSDRVCETRLGNGETDTDVIDAE